MIDTAAIHGAPDFDITEAVCHFAKEVKELLRNALLDTDSIRFTWRDRLKNRIYTLVEKCSSEGWDGENALPVSIHAIETAIHFIDLLPEGVKEPFITAENTGDIAFDWDLGEDMTFAVIASSGHAFYAGIFGDTNPHSTVRIHRKLPDPIKNILLTYFKK